MKIPLSWLQEVIDLNLTPHTIAQYLTQAGLEVDKVDVIAPQYRNVVVVEVLETAPHPNAEKLCLAKVSDGIETYKIVCGASNCRPGIKTALAKVGAVLIDQKGMPFTIKPAKLRGEESFGMLCSESELQMHETINGIIEFASSVSRGADVAQMYAETIFEISLTPNLGHCASILGVARELSAITGVPVKLPAFSITTNPHDPISHHLKLEVFDPKRCQRYCARLIRGVTVGASPDWLKKRLENSGMRSINSVVDATNYVMLLLGHPLHAFDFQHIEGAHLVVRDAHDGEKFVTLDGKEHTLNHQDLMICDVGQPLCLAGIMGGQNSEVTEKTRDVLLEAAYFEPSSIRRSSKRLGIQTESSKRFERGCDPNALHHVLDTVSALIVKISGGEICSEILEWSTGTFLPKKITCRLSRISSLLGVHFSLNEVEDLFKRMHLPYSWDGEDTFTVLCPTFRHDLTIEADLIEEVARLYGYDNFISEQSAPSRISSLPHTPIYVFERSIRNKLVSEGLQEVLNCDLIGPSLLDIIAVPILEESQIRVLNPASIEQSILRTSLLPGMLQVAKNNENRQIRDLQTFEIGRIHFKSGDQFREQTMAGILLTGQEAPAHWSKAPVPIDFYYLKGILENLFTDLGFHSIVFEPHHWALFHPGRQAQIKHGDVVIGVIGEIHPAIVQRLDFTERLYFAEFSLDDLMQLKSSRGKMQPFSSYPASERDWTVCVDENLLFSALLALVHQDASSLLESVDLVGIYRGVQVPEGKKNVTLRFTYRDFNKTLSQDVVDTEHRRMIAAVLDKLNLYQSQTPSP